MPGSVRVLASQDTHGPACRAGAQPAVSRSSSRQEPGRSFSLLTGGIKTGGSFPGAVTESARATAGPSLQNWRLGVAFSRAHRCVQVCSRKVNISTGREIISIVTVSTTWKFQTNSQGKRKQGNTK